MAARPFSMSRGRPLASSIGTNTFIGFNFIGNLLEIYWNSLKVIESHWVRSVGYNGVIICPAKSLPASKNSTPWLPSLPPLRPRPRGMPGYAPHLKSLSILEAKDRWRRLRVIYVIKSSVKSNLAHDDCQAVKRRLQSPSATTSHSVFILRNQRSAIHHAMESAQSVR